MRTLLMRTTGRGGAGDEAHLRGHSPNEAGQKINLATLLRRKRDVEKPDFG
jgi:hypothetical protein